MINDGTFDWFDISYNHKSEFSNAWVAGTVRLDSAEDIAGWLYETIQKHGPVVITEMNGTRC